MESTSVYIANLRLYNSGEMLGRWFTLPVSLAFVEDALHLDGSEQNGEEWIILDYENPYNLPISEYSDISELNHYVQRLEDLDDEVLKNLSYILRYGGESLEEILDNGGENYYFTREDNMRDVAMNYVNDMGGIENAVGSSNVDYYVDFNKLANDMEIEGTYFEGHHGLIQYVG